MTTCVIYEKDHRVRAELLAENLDGLHLCIDTLIINDLPVIIGLKELYFWGHGYPNIFCTKTSLQFVDLIKAIWKKNRNLEQVNLLSCNISHKGYSASSYMKSVIDQTRVWGYKNFGRNVEFRAPPTLQAPDGTLCSWSILLWHQESSTWAYVAGAPDKNKGDLVMRYASSWLESFKLHLAGNFVRAHDMWEKAKIINMHSLIVVKMNLHTKEKEGVLKEYQNKLKVSHKKTKVISGRLANISNLLVIVR